MLPLVLLLSLTQAPTAEPSPPATPPLEAPAAQAPADAPPPEPAVSPDVPPVELLPSDPEAEAAGPAAALKKPAGPEHSVSKRVWISGAAGVAASFAGLGLAMALTGSNPALDSNFATAMLCPILLSGVGFAVHSALGGRGEPILAYLAALAMMAGAAGISAAIDSADPSTAVVTALIGSVPATAAAILVLELSTKKSKRAPQLALLPTGVVGVF